MVPFLREIQKRDRCASIIWLHDGLWIDNNLSDDTIRSAEIIAARAVFPPVLEWTSVLRIQNLQALSTELVSRNLLLVVPTCPL